MNVATKAEEPTMKNETKTVKSSKVVVIDTTKPFGAFVKELAALKKGLKLTAAELSGARKMYDDAAKRDGKKEDAEKAEKVAAKAEKAKVEKKAEKSTAERKPTVASVCHEMIAAHKTNEEIFAALVKQFEDFNETKTWHINWHRADMVRKGLISKDAAAKFRH
jgi:cation transport regulator ChaB